MDEYQSTRGSIVAKSKVAADGEYNLSGERYSVADVAESQWPLVKVGEAFVRSTKTVMPGDLEGPLTYVGLENISQDTGHLVGDTVAENPAAIKSLKNEFEPGEILYGKLRPNLNKVWLSDRSGICSTDIYVIRPKQDNITTELYAYIFRSRRFNDAVVNQVKGAQLPRVGWDAIERLEIPLPPLEVQREVVAEIESYQRVIDGARQMVASYRPHIVFAPDWPTAELGEVSSGKPKYGSASSKAEFDGEVRYVRITDITESGQLKADGPVSPSEVDQQYFLETDDLLIARSGSVGRTYLHQVMPITHQYAGYLIRFRIDPAKALPKYVYQVTKSEAWNRWVERNSKVGTINNINAKQYSTFAFPLPSLETQRAIVDELDEEQGTIDQAERLASKMEQRIQDAIARVWED